MVVKDRAVVEDRDRVRDKDKHGVRDRDRVADSAVEENEECEYNINNGPDCF